MALFMASTMSRAIARATVTVDGYWTVDVLRPITRDTAAGKSAYKNA